MAGPAASGLYGVGLFSLVLVFVFSLLLTAVARRYALARALVDHPGERRSHSLPTPRGGGAALVLAVLAGNGLFLWLSGIPAHLLLAGNAGMLILAVMGYRDDHVSMPALPRLLVQVVTSAIVITVLTYPLLNNKTMLMIGLISVVMAGVINAYNFMDGSHGMAAGEGIFAGALYAFVFISAEEWAAAFFALSLACACAGFLPWNWPKPRIFMGDVGSAALGMAFALLAFHAWHSGALGGLVALLVLGVFLVDTGATLIDRILRKERWYHSHREHAYQRLLRRGWNHSAVLALYMAANVLVVLPLVLLHTRFGVGQTGVSLLGGVVLMAGWLVIRAGAVTAVEKGS